MIKHELIDCRTGRVVSTTLTKAGIEQFAQSHGWEIVGTIPANAATERLSMRQRLLQQAAKAAAGVG